MATATRGTMASSSDVSFASSGRPRYRRVSRTGVVVVRSASWWKTGKKLGNGGTTPTSSSPLTSSTSTPSSIEEEMRASRRARGDAIALGVDYGARRVGLAVSNGGAAPRPLRTLTHAGSATLNATVLAVLECARAECADRIVVGIPVPPGKAAKDRRGRGRGAPQTHRICARFAGEVADAVAKSEDEAMRGVRVYTYDESRTSKEAAERAGLSGGDATRAHLDAESAAILLERYFEGSYGEARLVEPFGRA